MRSTRPTSTGSLVATFQARESKFPLPPEAQYRLELGGGSVTLADFAWPEQRLLVYVDGLSKRIHGNPEQQRKDRILRVKAEAAGVEGADDQRGDRTMVGEFLEELGSLLGVEEI